MRIESINDLEAIGLRIAGSFGRGSIQAQLKQASDLNVPFVIIIGRFKLLPVEPVRHYRITRKIYRWQSVNLT